VVRMLGSVAMAEHGVKMLDDHPTSLLNSHT
jgi:hypothetical protein